MYLYTIYARLMLPVYMHTVHNTAPEGVYFDDTLRFEKLQYTHTSAHLVVKGNGYLHSGCCLGCTHHRRAAGRGSPMRRWTGIRAYTARSFRPPPAWRPAAWSLRWRGAGWNRSRSSAPVSWTRSRWTPGGYARCRTAAPRSAPARRFAAGSSPAAAVRWRTPRPTGSPRCALWTERNIRVIIHQQSSR